MSYQRITKVLFPSLGGIPHIPEQGTPTPRTERGVGINRGKRRGPSLIGPEGSERVTVRGVECSGRIYTQGDRVYSETDQVKVRR